MFKEEVGTSKEVGATKDELEIVRIAKKATVVAKAMATIAGRMQETMRLIKGEDKPPDEAEDKIPRGGVYGEIEDALDEIRKFGGVIEDCIDKL